MTRAAALGNSVSEVPDKFRKLRPDNVTTAGNEKEEKREFPRHRIWLAEKEERLRNLPATSIRPFWQSHLQSGPTH
ncbi:DUF2856 family protein [Salmonella enterica subsp. enterica]|nr:DUF2856 family protein [Salmonella enterica subsp. enterica]